MTDITFTVTDGADNQKLLLEFEYDESLVDEIKALPWNKVKYGFHYLGNDDSPLQNQVSKECWYIDYTNTAVTLVNEETSLNIPPEYQPTPNTNETNTDTTTKDRDVTIICDLQSNTSTVSTDITAIHNIIHNELTYDIKTTDLPDNLQLFEIDDTRTSFYNKDENEFPLGFTTEIIESLEQENYTITKTHRNLQSLDYIDTNWLETNICDNIHRQVVRELLDRKQGCIRCANVTDKIGIFARVIYSLDQPTLICAPESQVQHWKDRLESILGITPVLQSNTDTPTEHNIIITTHNTPRDDITQLLTDFSPNICITDGCDDISLPKLRFLTDSTTASYDFAACIAPKTWKTPRKITINATIGSIITRDELHCEITKLNEETAIFDTINPDQFGDRRTIEKNATINKEYTHHILFDPARLRAIASVARELQNTGTVFVSVENNIHGQLLTWLLNSSVSSDCVVDTLDENTYTDAYHELVSDCLTELNPIFDTDAVFLSGADNLRTTRELQNTISEIDPSVIISSVPPYILNISSIASVIFTHGNNSVSSILNTINHVVKNSTDRIRIVDVTDTTPYFDEKSLTRKQLISDYYDLETTLSIENAPITQQSSTIPVDSVNPLQQDSRTEFLTYSAD